MESDAERQRILRMRARKLRAMGRPQRVYPHEFKQVADLVKRAHDAGMTCEQIGKQVGYDRTAVADLLRGEVKTVTRTTYEKLLRLRIEPDIPAGRTRHHGAQIDSTGTLRKLRALVAIGYPARFLAHQLGSEPSQVRDLLARDGRRFVYTATALDVDRLYDKLADADPEDFGVLPAYARHARERAMEKVWAPPSAWDEDTIGDPSANPEWTGACGSEEGYQVHIRETFLMGNPIPVCDACREVVESRDYVEKDIFNVARFKELLDGRGINPRQLAYKMYGGTLPESAVKAKADTFYRWRSGSRVPKTRGIIQRLAQELEVSPSELMDEEAMRAEASRPPVERGSFNPYIFRAALAAGELSQRAAAELRGSLVTQQTIRKWALGEMKPSSPSKLQVIADHFGVNVKVFYS